MNTFNNITSSNKNQIDNVDKLELQNQPVSDESDFEESDFENSDSDYPSDFEEDPEEIARNERVSREIAEKEKLLAEVTKQVEEMKKFIEMMNNIQKGSDQANKMKNHINKILQQQSRK